MLIWGKSGEPPDANFEPPDADFRFQYSLLRELWVTAEKLIVTIIITSVSHFYCEPLYSDESALMSTSNREVGLKIKQVKK